jgi:hypothetical protein
MSVAGGQPEEDALLVDIFAVSRSCFVCPLAVTRLRTEQSELIRQAIREGILEESTLVLGWR